MPALIADPDMRKRDERFADREHHTTPLNPLHDKSDTTEKTVPLFAPSDFTYDADARTCVCLAGKSLYRTGAANVPNGYVGAHVRGAKRDCAPCALRAQCLRKPETSVVRTVAFWRGREDAATETHTMRMPQRLDTPVWDAQYGPRFATVEPVSGNVRHNKRLDRFTLRGRMKVNGQWLVFCLVHNIESSLTPDMPRASRGGSAARGREGRAYRANRSAISVINVESKNGARFSRDAAPSPPARRGFSYSLNARVLLQRLTKGCRQRLQGARRPSSEPLATATQG